MAHFAEIIKDTDIVLRVVVINNEDVNNNGGELSTQSEQWVANNIPNDELIKEELAGIYPETYWKQTSYNRSFRHTFAGRGWKYDKINDVFIEPKPFTSWTLNSNFDWVPPFEAPNDSTYGALNWDETLQTYTNFNKTVKWDVNTSSFVNI
jgi:hypothetical protein